MVMDAGSDRTQAVSSRAVGSCERLMGTRGKRGLCCVYVCTHSLCVFVMCVCVGRWCVGVSVGL